MVGNNKRSNTEKPIQKLGKPVFLLNRTNNAASRNRNILATLNGNLSAANSALNNSPLNYGSEFRDKEKLERLFYYNEG